MTVVFSSVLKTARVVPVFKKESKLDHSNITYSLDLDNNILHLMP